MATVTRFAPLAMILAFATPVQATVQSESTWVSGSGDDSNASSGCMISAPCQSFTAALSVTSSGGTVSCVGPAIPSPAPLTISKKVIIDCSEGGIYGDGSSGGNAINIDTAGIEVTLRGLAVYGVKLLETPPIGISITAAAFVRLENCKISGFGNAGIEVAPSAGNVTVKIQDSTISTNGSGVLVAPTGSASVSISIDRSRIENNSGGGIKTVTASGAINASISDSSVSFNADNGLNAVSSAGAQNMMALTRDIIDSNGLAGVQANGTTSAALIDTTLFDGNGTALSAVSGGRLLSDGNNRIVGSAGSGFTGSAPLQ